MTPESYEVPSSATILSTDEAAISPLTETISALPSYAARGLLYILLVIVVLALCGAFLHRMEVVIRVQATVIPAGKTQLIQASSSGIVQQVYVREGEHIKQDQRLMTIAAEDVGQKLAELKKTEQELSLAKHYLSDIVPQKVTALDKNARNEAEKFQLRQEIYTLSEQKAHEAFKRYTLELRNATFSAELLRKELAVHQRLYTLGLIAEIKLLEVQRTHSPFAVQKV